MCTLKVVTKRKYFMRKCQPFSECMKEIRDDKWHHNTYTTIQIVPVSVFCDHIRSTCKTKSTKKHFKHTHLFSECQKTLEALLPCAVGRSLIKKVRIRWRDVFWLMCFMHIKRICNKTLKRFDDCGCGFLKLISNLQISSFAEVGFSSQIFIVHICSVDMKKYCV